MEIDAEGLRDREDHEREGENLEPADEGHRIVPRTTPGEEARRGGRR
jgi:hypothetical protein